MTNRVTSPQQGGPLSKIAGEFTQQSSDELARHQQLFEIGSSLWPLYERQWNIVLLSLKRQSLGRLLYLDHLYQQVVGVPGVICEFGVQWGSTLVQLVNLRGIHEPYNHSRKIIGFDTFTGFPAVDGKDGGFSAPGEYTTADRYEEVLERLLMLHESFAPIPHIRKFELVKGDASATIDQWLTDNPHAIISMALFDMDVYKPTKDVLDKIRPRLTKGSLLVFDELNCPHFPGETRALDESMGLGNLRLRRHPHQPYGAWAVIGD